jgi:hypothetical protein
MENTLSPDVSHAAKDVAHISFPGRCPGLLLSLFQSLNSHLQHLNYDSISINILSPWKEKCRTF